MKFRNIRVRMIYPLARKDYERSEKVRGYSRLVSPVTALNNLDAGRLLASRLPTFNKGDHLAGAAHFEKERKRLQKLWSKAADAAAQQAFGRPFEFHDYKISGIGRDEFTDHFKNILRTLAHESSFAGSAANAHKAAAAFVTRSLAQRRM